MSASAWDSAKAKDSRFAAEAFMLVFGLAADTALGLPHYMKVSGHVIRSGMNEGIKAVSATHRLHAQARPPPPAVLTPALLTPRTPHLALRTPHHAPRTPHPLLLQIEREIAEHGTDEDKECLHYVLHEKAGGSLTRFANGVRDQGRNNETFDDFCNHPTCTACNLEPSHVLALRLYSTAVYKSINGAAFPLASALSRPPAATATAYTVPLPTIPTLQAPCVTLSARSRTRSPSWFPLWTRVCGDCVRSVPMAAERSPSAAASHVGTGVVAAISSGTAAKYYVVGLL